MFENLHSITTILVSYNFFHDPDDYGYPTREAIGTLIHDINDVKHIKYSEYHCRLAEEHELLDWRGPVSPWHKARLYPNRADHHSAL